MSCRSILYICKFSLFAMISYFAISVIVPVNFIYAKAHLQQTDTQPPVPYNINPVDISIRPHDVPSDWRVINDYQEESEIPQYFTAYQNDDAIDGPYFNVNSHSIVFQSPEDASSQISVIMQSFKDTEMVVVAAPLIGDETIAFEGPFRFENSNKKYTERRVFFRQENVIIGTRTLSTDRYSSFAPAVSYAEQLNRKVLSFSEVRYLEKSFSIPFEINLEVPLSITYTQSISTSILINVRERIAISGTEIISSSVNADIEPNDILKFMAGSISNIDEVIGSPEMAMIPSISASSWLTTAVTQDAELYFEPNAASEQIGSIQQSNSVRISGTTKQGDWYMLHTGEWLEASSVNEIPHELPVVSGYSTVRITPSIPSATPTPAPLSTADFTRNNWTTLQTDPEKYKDSTVEIIGKVFQNPERGENYVAWQMWADPQNNDWNTMVYTRDPDFEIANGDYIRVIGKVDGAFEGTNALGAKLTIPLIIVDKATIVDSTAAASPTLKRVDVQQSISQNNLDVTVNRIEFAANETRVYVTLLNNSGLEATFYNSNAKVVQGRKQFDADAYSREYPQVQNDILPSVESSGVIVFPPMEISSVTTIYIEAKTSDYS